MDFHLESIGESVGNSLLRYFSWYTSYISLHLIKQALWLTVSFQLSHNSDSRAIFIKVQYTYIYHNVMRILLSITFLSSHYSYLLLFFKTQSTFGTELFILSFSMSFPKNLTFSIVTTVYYRLRFNGLWATYLRGLRLPRLGKCIRLVNCDFLNCHDTRHRNLQDHRHARQFHSGDIMILMQ